MAFNKSEINKWLKGTSVTHLSLKYYHWRKCLCCQEHLNGHSIDFTIGFPRQTIIWYGCGRVLSSLMMSQWCHWGYLASVLIFIFYFSIFFVNTWNWGFNSQKWASKDMLTSWILGNVVSCVFGVWAIMETESHKSIPPNFMEVSELMKCPFNVQQTVSLQLK